MPFLIPLISTLAPILAPLLLKRAIPKAIIRAEDQLSEAPGALKKEWVMQGFTDVLEIMEARGWLNDRWKAVAAALLPSISERIEVELTKLKAKGKI